MQGKNWYLVYTNGKYDAKLVYSKNESGTEKINKLRVQPTFTRNSSGYMAPIFITVT